MLQFCSSKGRQCYAEAVVQCCTTCHCFGCRSSKCQLRGCGCCAHCLRKQSAVHVHILLPVVEGLLTAKCVQHTAHTLKQVSSHRGFPAGALAGCTLPAAADAAAAAAAGAGALCTAFAACAALTAALAAGPSCWEPLLARNKYTAGTNMHACTCVKVVMLCSAWVSTNTPTVRGIPAAATQL